MVTLTYYMYDLQEISGTTRILCWPLRNDILDSYVVRVGVADSLATTTDYLVGSVL